MQKQQNKSSLLQNLSMGNSSFDPKQIDLATFNPNLLQTLQESKSLITYISSNFKRKPQKQRMFQNGSRQFTFWQVSSQDLSLNDLQILFQSLKQVKFVGIQFNQLQCYQEGKLQKSKREDFNQFREQRSNKQVSLLKSLCYPYFVDLQVLSINKCGIRSLQSIQFLNAPKLVALFLNHNPFISFKPFNKCRFKNLKFLDINNSLTCQTFYLSNFTRCDLDQQIVHINLESDSQLNKAYLQNHLQMSKQAIDLNAMFKWNSKIIQGISIRQRDTCKDLNDLIELHLNQAYQFKIGQKIRQKYLQIEIGTIQQQLTIKSNLKKITEEQYNIMDQGLYNIFDI